jgi:NTE family protein
VRDSRGHLIVDGGVTKVQPVSVVRDMGADVVIASDALSSGEAFRSSPMTAAGMMVRSTMALLRQTAGAQSGLADVVIEPKIAHIRPDQIRKGPELMRLGEEAARDRMAEINQLISRAG